MAQAAISQNIIGKTLQASRERRGLSLQQTAEKAGIDPTLLSRMERGLVRDVKLTTLASLATVLAFSLDEFAVEARLLPRKRYIGPDGVGEAELAQVADQAESMLKTLRQLTKRASQLKRL